jgi:hypothetical protein
MPDDRASAIGILRYIRRLATMPSLAPHIVENPSRVRKLRAMSLYLAMAIAWSAAKILNGK